MTIRRAARIRTRHRPRRHLIYALVPARTEHDLELYKRGLNRHIAIWHFRVTWMRATGRRPLCDYAQFGWETAATIRASRALDPGHDLHHAEDELRLHRCALATHWLWHHDSERWNVAAALLDGTNWTGTAGDLHRVVHNLTDD